jgi:uncharacterized protein (TIGR00369 family)
LIEGTEIMGGRDNVETCSRFEAAHPGFEAAVRDSFARQGMNATLGASLTLVEPGRVHIGLRFSQHLTQQNGHLHAGAIATIADNACGYAALSLAPADADVLAAEFKMNLLAPARAPLFEARARVVRAGRTLTVVQADVFGLSDDDEEMVATMLQTVFVKRPRGAS